MSVFFRDFVIGLRYVELEHAYFMLSKNTSPKLYEYIHRLDEIEYKDGTFHAYCGIVKNIINNFICYWTDIISDTLKEADRINFYTSRDEILKFMEETIETHQTKQVDFGGMYLPTNTDEEQRNYELVEERYKEFLVDLYKLKEKLIKFDTKETLKQFVKELLEFSVKKKNDIFEFSHTYIALALVDNVHKLRGSLEEILTRIRNNLKKSKADRDKAINDLLHKLYDLNKDQLTLSRMLRRSSEDMAEIQCSIQRVRNRVKVHKLEKEISYLDNEFAYWEDRLAEFDRIHITLHKLKAEEKNVEKCEKRFNSMRCPESVSEAERACWGNMGENIKKRKAFVERKIKEASKALMTFFAIRGYNRIFYEDHIGKYTVDEYGHQIYYFDYGSQVFHVNCDGTYRRIQYIEHEYYYDDNGRYIYDDDGNKLYQCAPCTSTYKLGEDDVLVKTTKDCGHSDKKNPFCKMQLKDPMDVEILPLLESIDITNSLEPEVVKYLWDTFGGLLPDVLNDTGLKMSKNPIHYFAHRLLEHKYNISSDKIEAKHEEGQAYRTIIYKKRKDKTIAKSKAWKTKQLKRRKPEEIDDAEAARGFDAHVAKMEFINELNKLV